MTSEFFWIGAKNDFIQSVKKYRKKFTSTMSNLCFMAEDIFVDEQWYFITTSHGTETVWNQVKQRQVIINTASDFIRCAEKAVPGVTFILLTPDDVRENMEILDDCWIRVKQIPKIQSSNFFVTKENEFGLWKIILECLFDYN